MIRSTDTPCGNAIQSGFVVPFINPDTPWPEAVSAAVMALATHIRTSETVRRYFDNLPKGVDTECPDSPVDELVKYLAEQNGQIDKRDPLVNIKFISANMYPMFALERQCLDEVARYNHDITELEEKLLRFALRIAEPINNLHRLWFFKLAVPFQRLDDAGQKAYKATLEKQLSQFDYTVYDYADGVAVNRQTWAQAFSTAVESIDQVFNTMRTFRDKTIRNYLKALRFAYNCVNIAELEEHWAKVDEMWIKINGDCRMFPVHGMENGYEHPFGVSPEFRLVVRTTQCQELIAEMRVATPAYARYLHIDEKLVTLAEQKMGNMDIGVFATAIRAGICANFRYAGQVVPNRQDILARGGKNFMDPDSIAAAVRMYHDLALKHCAPDSARIVVEAITPHEMFTHTIGHECTHPIGCTPENDIAMGGEVKHLIEEAKATIGGLAAILHQLDSSKWSEVAALSIARVCRFFTKATYENPSAQPYVRENIVMANLLSDAGVVILAPEGIMVNFNEAVLQKWKQSLAQFYSDVILAYNAENPQQTVAVVKERYCSNTPAVNAWIAWVNR